MSNSVGPPIIDVLLPLRVATCLGRVKVELLMAAHATCGGAEMLEGDRGWKYSPSLHTHSYSTESRDLPEE